MDGIQALRIVTLNDEQYICDILTSKIATISCFKVLKTSKVIKTSNFITEDIVESRVWTSVKEKQMYIPAIRIKTIREIKYKLKAHPKL